MKYMLLLHSNPADEPAPDSDAFGPYMGEWAAYSQALEEAGAMVTGEALQGDVLLQRQASALVALNRAIAVDHVHGPAAALAALDAIPRADDLTGDVGGYVYFHTARADVLARLDRHDDAAAALDRAIECGTNESERSFLRRRRRNLDVAPVRTRVVR